MLMVSTLLLRANQPVVEEESSNLGFWRVFGLVGLFYLFFKYDVTSVNNL